MPSPEQYADAIRGITGIASVLDDQRQADARAVYTLALRWLRVGAAMEAGTLRLQPPSFWNDEWQANYSLGPAEPFGEGVAPDPLTAAERAMGVGNG